MPAYALPQYRFNRSQVPRNRLFLCYLTFSRQQNSRQNINISRNLTTQTLIIVCRLSLFNYPFYMLKDRTVSMMN